MRKEFTVISVEASPIGEPAVFLCLNDAQAIRKETTSEFAKHHLILAGFSRRLGGELYTRVKMGLNEYADLNIRVGDKIRLNLEKIGEDGASNV